MYMSLTKSLTNDEKESIAGVTSYRDCFNHDACRKIEANADAEKKLELASYFDNKKLMMSVPEIPGGKKRTKKRRRKSKRLPTKRRRLHHLRRPM
jgi:hypothetical protein